jgi:hypothetical protein
MDNWNGLDFLIFLIFTVNVIHGMVRGATKEIISMMCLSAALIVAIKFTVPLANFFNGSPLITDVVDSKVLQNFMLAIGAGPLTSDLLKQTFYCISMLICFVGAFSICEAGLSRPGFVEVFSFPYATLNRKVGAALGCTRGFIFVLLLLLIVSLLFKGGPIGGNLYSGSYFARLFQGSTKKLDELIIGQQPERYQEIFKEKGLYDEKQIMKQLGTDVNPFPPGTTPAPGTAVPVNNPPANSGTAPSTAPANSNPGTIPNNAPASGSWNMYQ